MATAVKVPKQGSPDAVNWILVIVILGALAFSLFMGWQSLFNPTKEQPAITATTSQVTPALPTPILNQSHQRLGSPVVVDQKSIGKDNPFK